jgi:hypothetical protein
VTGDWGGHINGAALGVRKRHPAGMQVQLLRHAVGHLGGVAIFSVADDRMADQRHVRAQLVLAAGDGLQADPGHRRRGLVDDGIVRNRALRPVVVRVVGLVHALFACPAALDQRLVDLALFGLRHAVDQRPIDLAHRARLKQFSERCRHLAGLGNHQDAGCVPVQPVHQPWPVIHLCRQPHQQPVHVARGARSALHRKPGRLVQHVEVLVLEQDQRLEIRLVGCTERLRLGVFAPGFRLVIEVQRRHPDHLARFKPRVGLHPRTIHPHLAGAQQLRQLAVTERREMHLEPAVQPHALFSALDVYLLYAAHCSTVLASHRPANTATSDSTTDPLA